jgi:hypothetical protein
MLRHREIRQRTQSDIRKPQTIGTMLPVNMKHMNERASARAAIPTTGRSAISSNSNSTASSIRSVSNNSTRLSIRGFRPIYGLAESCEGHPDVLSPSRTLARPVVPNPAFRTIDPSLSPSVYLKSPVGANWIGAGKRSCGRKTGLSESGLERVFHGTRKSLGGVTPCRSRSAIAEPYPT